MNCQLSVMCKECSERRHILTTNRILLYCLVQQISAFYLSTFECRQSTRIYLPIQIQIKNMKNNNIIIWMPAEKWR